MLKASVYLISLLSSFSVIANSNTQERKTSDFYSSGGVIVNGQLCPKSATDVIVPITSLDPAPINIYMPEMTISGIKHYIDANNIRSIDQLLHRLPADYKSHFSFVEHTRATGQANLEFPRIVIFGSDGRFMMNVGTKPDDPKYNLLDVAELDDKTGRWSFSVFDFNQKPIALTRDDKSCIECHGDANSRPVWGSNMDWPGVFGDNVAPGLQGEALDGKHAKRFNEIVFDEGNNSPRFDALKWRQEKMMRGSIRLLADHAAGPELIISNVAMGTATARGIFLRMKYNYPERYKKLQYALLMLGYEKMAGSRLSNSTKANITALITSMGGTGNDLDSALSILGIDADEAFSVATLFAKEPSVTHWSLGGGNLYDLVLLQVLADLKATDNHIKTILSEQPIAIEAYSNVQLGVHGCPDTVANIDELVDFKMLHLFKLQGLARYKVHKVYYPKAVEHVYKRVFVPISATLNQYLQTQLH